MPAYTATVSDGVYDAVEKKCKANSYRYTFALRVGLMAFLEADHAELMRMTQKYKNFKE